MTNFDATVAVRDKDGVKMKNHKERRARQVRTLAISHHEERKVVRREYFNTALGTRVGCNVKMLARVGSMRMSK